MAAVAVANLPQSQKEELLCTYASLILHDEKMDITSDNIAKLIKAAGASVEPYMPVLFARALGSTNIGDLLSAAGTVSAAAPAAASGAPAAGGKAPAAAAKKEEEPEEEEEDDIGFSLFDD